MYHNIKLYPLKFKEIYKDYIWGGRNLRKIGKPIKDSEIVAESWEVSDCDQDISIVKNGKLAGKTLRELVALYGEDICPRTENGKFPILIKYLDANKRVSVQVHADDEYVRVHEGNSKRGKNECWYIIDAPHGAEVIIGVKKGVTKDILKELIKEKRIEEGLNRLSISRGDFIYVKSGTVHSLFEGIIVCEIQENSDNVYRLYDWGRVGQDGRPRLLHIEKALDVIDVPSMKNYNEYMSDIVVEYDRAKKNTITTLVRRKCFNIDYLRFDSDLELSLEDCHFHTLNIIEGKGVIQYRHGEVFFQKGETILIPRIVKNYAIKTDAVEILKTFL